MKLKYKDVIFMINENAVLRISPHTSAILLIFNWPGFKRGMSSPHGSIIAEYATMDRAKAVLEDIWNAMKVGEDCYELPEQ